MHRVLKARDIHDSMYYVAIHIEEVGKMKTISRTVLARIVKTRRQEMKWTQQELSERTGIHRAMIGRIESEAFTPSIAQLESLSLTLGFELTDLLVDREETRSFIALRSETLSRSEREGVEKIFSMMLTLRQQMVIRSKFEHETGHIT
jgi:transcriptional regulator with XRE-family HTH domain